MSAVRRFSTKSLKAAYPEVKRIIGSLLDEDGLFPVLSKSQKKRLAEKQPDDPTLPRRQAAVLVLLCSIDGNPSLLFTKRSENMRQHAAEISFPGGHVDAGDGSPIETALRETTEELLPRDSCFLENIEILATATPLPALNGTPVTPVLAAFLPEISQPLSHHFPGDPGEVDTIFGVSVVDLLAEETVHELPKNRMGLTQAPVFPSPHGNIWGLTAYILRPYLHQVLRPAFELQGVAKV